MCTVQRTVRGRGDRTETLPMPALARALRPLCLLVALFTTTPALAEGGTAVFPPLATNLEPGPAQALGQLLANEYARASGGPVVLPTQAGAAVQPGMSLAAAAGALGVEEYLDTTAIGLGKGMLVTSTRHRRDGTPVYSAQMRAQSVEDLPEVSARLAQALHQQVPPEKTRTLSTVTQRETRTPARVAAEQVVGFKTFLSRPLGADFEPLTGLGFNSRFEQERYFLEFGFGMLIPADGSESRQGYGGLTSEFGANYYLATADVSPYVGAGLSPRLIFSEGMGSPANLSAWGQLGVMFLRTHATRLYTDLRVTQNLLPVNREGEDAFTNDARYPTELSIGIGIGW
jgi:hypothetical protein